MCLLRVTQLESRDALICNDTDILYSTQNTEGGQCGKLNKLAVGSPLSKAEKPSCFF